MFIADIFTDRCSPNFFTVWQGVFAIELGGLFAVIPIIKIFHIIFVVFILFVNIRIIRILVCLTLNNIREIAFGFFEKDDADY